MPDDKKIIVDEDWKSQVQAEKEAAAKERPAADAPSAATPPGREPGGASMPAASFELLLTMLATEALVAMGQLPHPLTQQPQVQRDQAKYLIDTIEILREKTKGNLEPGEDQLMESILHQLRLVFVETAASAASEG